MNDLCADIGYKSVNHVGEQLCGDHVEIVDQGENSSVIVLADGLGSGVKASILSTLTSKIISTMMAEGLPLEECVDTIAATLPVCSVRGVAYSTFTIIHLIDNQWAELIQYDNPRVILIRGEKECEYPSTEMTIGGKKICKSLVKLQENDIFIAMSDGCPHAGIGVAYNFGWNGKISPNLWLPSLWPATRPRPYPPFWWMSATSCTDTLRATTPRPAWSKSASASP